MLKRIIAVIGLIGLTLPNLALAAGGSITPSGGGKFNVGSNFTITVKASGTTFDSLQGVISVSGPVSVVSFSAGSATWMPGKSPANGSQFVGLTSATSSLTVATITLKGTKTGSGSVSVSGVRLARSGAEVGTGGGSTSFTLKPAPTPPGTVTVTSSTHPDQTLSYDIPTVELAWTAPANGANGYSYLLDQIADTTPAATIKDTATSAKFENLVVGTYYFHIRANNKDGWSAPTHFKISIKPKQDDSLAKPKVTEITLSFDYKNDITSGTLTGIIIKGTGPIGYTMNFTFDPAIALPVEKYPALVADTAGSWQLAISDPVKAGFYKLTVQGRLESTVSTASDVVTFEVAIANGGSVKIISTEDSTQAYKDKVASEKVLVAKAKSRQKALLSFAGAIVLLIIAAAYILRRRIFKSLK